MARKCRQVSLTGVYHIVLRGINKKAIFDYNEDKKYFISLLSKILQNFMGKYMRFVL